MALDRRPAFAPPARAGARAAVVARAVDRATPARRARSGGREDPLGRLLARAVAGRGARAPHDGPLLQRAITVDGKRYSDVELADALKADEDVVWHDEYVAELAAMSARDQDLADHGKLMMWLAGAVMAAKRPAPPAPVPAAAEAAVAPPSAAPSRAKAAAAPLPPTQVSLAELNRAAPIGGTPGQRYDKQADTHTSVTFKAVRDGVVRIVGFHRTLASGSHIYWAKHAGDGKFKLSSSSGAEIESIARNKTLEDAWKAVSRTARKLRCEALEPTWS